MRVICGGRVLNPGAGEAPAADVVVVGDAIADIVAPGAVTDAGAETIDASGKLLIPGLVNSHTHTQGNMAKGVGDRWTLEVFLNWGPWSAGRRAEHHYVSALIGAAEMIAKGCTAAYDLFGEFPTPTRDGIAAVAQAYADAGMRAVIAPMMADRTLHQSLPGFVDGLPDDVRADLERARMAPAAEILAACRAVLAGWAHDRVRVRPALGPTIPQFCSDEFLIGCRDLGREFDVRLHMHVAESKPDAVSAARGFGKTQVAHLADLGLLGPRFTAAHGVWLTETDMALLADSGASVAHNPGANMKLGSGVAAARRMIEAGITLGIGTDGARSSDNLNMFEAMRMAAFASRLQGRPAADWLSAGEAFRHATEESARLLGLDGRIGRLAKGYKADVVFLDLGHVNYIPLNDAETQLVYCEDGTAVDSVMIGGRMVFAEGRHVTVDIARLAERAQAARQEMAELNAEAGRRSARLEPFVAHFCEGLRREPFPVHRVVGAAPHEGGS